MKKRDLDKVWQALVEKAWNLYITKDERLDFYEQELDQDPELERHLLRNVRRHHLGVLDYQYASAVRISNRPGNFKRIEQAVEEGTVHVLPVPVQQVIERSKQGAEALRRMALDVGYGGKALRHWQVDALIRYHTKQTQAVEAMRQNNTLVGRVIDLCRERTNDLSRTVGELVTAAEIKQLQEGKVIPTKSNRRAKRVNGHGARATA